MRKHENFDDLEWVGKAMVVYAIILGLIACIVFYFAFKAFQNKPQKQTTFKESTHYKCDTLGVKTNYFK